MAQPVGRVQLIQRFPLKSAGGEQLTSVWVGAEGLRDDRRWVVYCDGEPVSGKELAELGQIGARSMDDRLEVRTENGWQAPDAAWLARQVPRPGELSIVDAPGSNQQVAAVHLASVDAQAAPSAPTGCDPDPRANLMLALNSPGAEREWVDQVVQIGEVTMRITRLPKRCLGVYAAVLTPGTVRQGDEIVLSASSAAE